jgi:HD-like signal output (HDOD) protein/CheY-like chemotaxis protein
MAEADIAGPGLRVLFVDDDPNVLSGLRRLLHAERDQWAICFATGATEALELFAARPFDVVVSDMRMTSMDGADLLTKVRRLTPATVRIVLSGQTDRASAMKAASVAHQYLSKPTDAETLKNAIGRAQELERRLGQPRLRSALGGLERLPSPSATVRSLNAALVDPSSEIDTVVRIVEPDLGISAKILQLVNSAFFALPREVTSLREAVAYLGLDNVRAMATSADLIQALSSGPAFDLLAVRLQAHCAGVLQLARYILPRSRRPADLFLGALLHDLGLLAAASLVPDGWADLGAVGTGPWTVQKEKDLLGASHADIGAYLLCLWGMPYGAVDIVARHHDPGPVAGGALAEVHAVFLAEALFAEVDDVPGHTGGLDEQGACELGVVEMMDDWRCYRDKLIGGHNAR